MDSDPNQHPPPANELQLVDDSRNPKRQRIDNQFMLTTNLNRDTGPIMDLDDDPNSLSTATASATAAHPTTPGPATAEEALHSKLLKDIFQVIINKRVNKYGSDRYEHYNRQVALRSLSNHATKNTFPKDLCFTVQTGNPYKKSTPNRDALLQEEQNILMDAKKRILHQRIHTAESDLQRLATTCEQYFYLDIIVNDFKDEFKDAIVLTDAQCSELKNAYNLCLINKRTNMDNLFKRKEEQYQKHIAKKQKTTPISATLNEQQFKSSLIDLMKDYLQQQQAKDKKSSIPAPSTDHTKAREKTNKKHKQSNSSKPVSSSSSNTSNNKNHSTNNDKKKNVQKQQQQPKSRQVKFNDRTFTKPTYADKVKSYNKNRVIIEHLDDSDTEDDDDGFITVTNKKRRKNAKNDSATDPRTVPKRPYIRKKY